MQANFQIDLLPIGKGMHSLLEVPPRGNEQSEAGDNNSEATNTVTLITRNEGSLQANLIEAYFNGNKCTVTVDTCANASIIHHPANPALDRIFKVRDKVTYYLPERGDVN